MHEMTARKSVTGLNDSRIYSKEMLMRKKNNPLSLHVNCNKVLL